MSDRSDDLHELATLIEQAHDDICSHYGAIETAKEKAEEIGEDSLLATDAKEELDKLFWIVDDVVTRLKEQADNMYAFEDSEDDDEDDEEEDDDDE